MKTSEICWAKTKMPDLRYGLITNKRRKTTSKQIWIPPALQVPCVQRNPTEGVATVTKTASNIESSISLGKSLKLGVGAGRSNKV